MTLSLNNSGESLKKLNIWQRGCSFIFVILGVVLMACSDCAAQDTTRGVFTETLQGSVKEIDAEKSTLVFQTAAGDIELFIPGKAKLFRGTEAVKFSDIEKEDEAVISFYSDSKDRKQVLSMVMEE